MSKMFERLGALAKNSDWRLLSACQSCGSKSFYLVKIHREMLGLCKCQKCNIVLLNPIPKRHVYPKSHLREVYIPNLRTSGIFKDNEFTVDYAKLKNRYATVCELADKHFADRENEFILDIGCGIGLPMMPLIDAGFSVTGIDQDESFVEFGTSELGLNLFAHNIEQGPIDRKASYAVLCSVLEHVDRPVTFLDNIRNNLLQPGGLLIITVPNLLSLEYIRDGDRWTNNLNGGHLYYFTEDTLKSTAESAGYSVVDIFRRPDSYSGSLAFVATYLRDFLELEHNISGGIGMVLKSPIGELTAS